MDEVQGKLKALTKQHEDAKQKVNLELILTDSDPKLLQYSTENRKLKNILESHEKELDHSRKSVKTIILNY